MMQRHLSPALFVLFLIAAVFFLTHCTQEYIEPAEPVCFERDVLPIFISNCTQSGCHNATDRAEGYNLTSYEGIVREGIEPGNYRKSKMYKVLVTPFGRMPQPPYDALTVDQIETIALWIEEGAENTTCEGDECNTANMSYSLDIRPVMEAWCNGCHSGSSPSGGINTSNHAGLRTVALNGRLVGAIEHASGFIPMPENAPKLPACTIAQIKQWVADGALNN